MTDQRNICFSNSRNNSEGLYCTPTEQLNWRCLSTTPTCQAGRSRFWFLIYVVFKKPCFGSPYVPDNEDVIPIVASLHQNREERRSKIRLRGWGHWYRLDVSLVSGFSLFQAFRSWGQRKEPHFAIRTPGTGYMYPGSSGRRVAYGEAAVFAGYENLRRLCASKNLHFSLYVISMLCKTEWSLELRI